MPNSLYWYCQHTCRGNIIVCMISCCSYNMCWSLPVTFWRPSIGWVSAWSMALWLDIIVVLILFFSTAVKAEESHQDFVKSYFELLYGKVEWKMSYFFSQNSLTQKVLDHFYTNRPKLSESIVDPRWLVDSLITRLAEKIIVNYFSNWFFWSFFQAKMPLKCEELLLFCLLYYLLYL